MSSAPQGPNSGMRKPPDRPGGTPTPPSPRLGSPLVWLLVIGLGLLFFRGLFQDAGAPRVPYSRMKEALRQEQVERVVLSERQVKVHFSEAVPGTPPGEDGPRVWVSNRVADDAELLQILEERNLTYEAEAESTFLNWMLIWVVPLLLIFLFWSYLFRRSASQMGQGPPGVMSFGKSKARVYAETNTGITFSDVAGVDEAADELKEIVDFLKNPEKFRRLGGKIPKGVMLVGPPGTGKTLLARAVAGEAGVPFFSLSGSEFVEMFVGVGAARVRDLFAQASSRAPAIIFIDELDAIGKSRNSGMVSGHDEREQTLNQLLAEMDGFDPRVGLVVLAATNRPEILDPALMRPGRFDRHVLVDRPDKRGREKILTIHAREVKLGPDVNLKEIAARTPGLAGAELANLVNEATLLAGRVNRQFVTMRDFDEAIERVVAGLEKKNRRINEREKEIVAYHESGHALVSTLLPHTDVVQKVSIIPRGLSALGYTRQTPLDDRYLMSKEELLDKIAALMGGRAAEEEMVGSVSTGASNDFKQATDIARLMVAEYGMSDVVGPLSLQDGQRSTFLKGMGGNDRNCSEETSRTVDGEVSRIVHEGMSKARTLIRYNRSYLEKLAARLLTVEAIDGEELRELLKGAKVPPQLVHARPLPLAADGEQPAVE